MALQTDTNRYRRKKNASIFVYDEEEPKSLADKRKMVFDSIFGPGGSNGTDGAGDPEPDSAGKEEPRYTVPSSVRSARDKIFGTLRDQKVDPASYEQDAPDKPKIDEEGVKRAKNLSKVAFIAQGVDALTDAIGTATSEDYAAAPADFSTAGFTAYERLANLDYDHKQRLRNYKQDVFDTKQYNRGVSREAKLLNSEADTKIAEQELEYALADEQALADAEQAKIDAQNEREEADNAVKLSEKEAYVDAANRLISQGQSRAAMVALKKAGLPSDEIAAAIQSDSSYSSSSSSGSGKDAPGWDPTVQNMIDRFRSLEEQLGEGAYVGGEPQTAKAKEYEYLKDELGRERYNPIYQQQETQGKGGKQGPTGEELEQMGLSQAESEGDPEAIDNTNLVKAITSSTNEQDTKKYIDRWVKEMRNQGYSDEEIEYAYDVILQNKQVADIQRSNKNRREKNKTGMYPADDYVGPETLDFSNINGE